MASQVTGSGAIQATLWAPRARDWAAVQEAVVRPLYEEVLQRLEVTRGTRLLDAGCGSCLALALAAERGARVSGVDATQALLEIARERAPGADLRLADLESLPFADAEFDAVTGFNSFQYAVDPPHALTEAGRVTRKGGRVVIAVWGTAEETEASAYLRALGGLLPPPPPGSPGPFALSADGALAELAAAAGLQPDGSGSVSCPWEYPDLETALRGLLSAGPAVRAINHSGQEAVSKAVADSIAPFRRPGGGYRIENRFRYLVARV